MLPCVPGRGGGEVVEGEPKKTTDEAPMIDSASDMHWTKFGQFVQNFEPHSVKVNALNLKLVTYADFAIRSYANFDIEGYHLQSMQRKPQPHRSDGSLWRTLLLSICNCIHLYLRRPLQYK